MRAAKILIACCFAVTAVGVQLRQKKPSSPDIYLVTIDTLRADHVHCYGYERVQTPALDGLAKDGIRFAQAFTPSPITNTSHTTILTGLLPSSHGVTDFAVPLAAVHPTWAELLKQKGYHTAAFIGAVILDSKSLAPGLDRGFDFYDNFPEHPLTKSRFGRVERRGMDVVQHAEKWMNAHPAGPHFVWVHLYDPHDPYEPPPPYSEKYKDHLYDGEIAFADSALGRFLNYLKEQHWYEGALIIVVGDHGEGLGEHGEDTHGIFLYDLRSDPGEIRNAYVPWDSTVQKLRKELAKLSAKAAGKPSAAAVAPSTTDELRALGYLSTADARSSTDVPEPSLLPDPKDKVEEQNLLHVAMMASEDGQTAKARTALEKLLRLDNRSEIGLSQLGRLEMESENYTKAALYLGRACEVNPQNATIAYDYGRALELSGVLVGARYALQASLKLNPKQLAARLLLGQIWLKSNDPKAAEDEFEAALPLQ